MSESLFAKTKQALNEQDSEGLLRVGAPSDKYEFEVRMIVDQISKFDAGANLTVHDIRNILENMWNEMFGPFCEEELRARRNHFQAAAEKIVG